MYRLILLLVCTAAAMGAAGDFDGDGAVGLSDLGVFAEDWLVSDPNIADPNTDADANGVVDMNDFAAFSRAWKIGHVNQPPTAAAVESWCYPGQSSVIALGGRDPENRPLTYRLVDAPTQGVMVRQSAGVYTYYAHQTASGTDQFSYCANDGEYDSAPADVNVAIYTPTVDNIVFAHRSSVVIPDGESVNIDGSFTTCFYFRTHWPEGALFAKRAETGGPGLVIGIENACLVSRLYDADGTCYTLRTWNTVNDGRWRMVAVSYDSAGNLDFNGDPAVTYVLSHFLGISTEDEVVAIVPEIDPSNPEDVVFGRYGDRMFYGAIDSFSNYATALDTFFHSVVAIETRSSTSHSLSPAYFRRFLLDEGTGQTVLDVSETVEGSLSNHGRTVWADEFFPLDDRWRHRSRLRGVDGARMLPNYRTNE